MLVITPLTFLGGAFYSIEMLAPTWRAIALWNPVVYVISGIRWSFLTLPMLVLEKVSRERWAFCCCV